MTNSPDETDVGVVPPRTTPPPKTHEGKENVGPLSSHRDPRRTPLLSRMPFAPAPRPNSARPASAAAARGGKRKDVTPAYAYKNAATGLLEIRTGVPPSLSMVAHEDDTVVGLDDGDTVAEAKLALYPIALNGGGAGLYRDPREFANGNVAGFSTNHRTASARRAPLKSHVRFAWPYEVKTLARAAGVRTAERDLEAGPGPTLSFDDDDRTTRTRQSIGTLASAMHPWKLWENVHHEMARRAAVRTRRLEDEASHVTLARQKNKAARVSSVYNDDDFDFALVLAPHDAYAFWASHLDFREEALHLVDDEGPEMEELDDEGQDDDSTIATATCGGANAPKKSDTVPAASPTSPVDGSGLRRRKRVTPTSESNRLPHRFSSAKKTPSSSGRIPSHRSPYRDVRTSERVFSQRKSLFDRALDRFSPPGLSQRNLSALDESHEDDVSPTASRNGNRRSAMSPYVQRRRWGNNYDGSKLSTPNLTSPPIHSLKKGTSSQKRRTSSNIFQWRVQNSSARRSRGEGGSGRKGESHSATKASGKRNRDEDDLDAAKEGEDMFFASPGVPRGIAARVNGLGQFLEALKIGIVVRRHWPKGKSVFVQLFSDDGGDSIQFKFIPDDEAVIALREQAQRYNGRRRKKKARVSFGEFESRRTSRDSQTVNQHDKLDSSVPLPDYLKAKIDREEDIRKKGGVLNAIAHNASDWRNTFAIDAKEIVQVQPATHIDPFSKEGEKLGTSSLRQSNTKYVKRNTFSVIVPSMQGKLIQDYSSIDLTEKWCDGEHQSLFKSLDIEMATEGEYWMVLKGFILLHRDASTGRFAAQRAGGFGSYYRHAEVMDTNAGHGHTQTFTEALPPPKTLMQKLLRKDDVEQAEEAKYNATPPPSDYFLGFSSPGTQIWGRLRQAGLETQRIYALDTRKVMLKVRCPVERLQDVAEALKLKLKTRDGDFAPFREDMIAQFEPTDDGFVSCEDDVERVVSLFRSSERQKIIDFIIGSRIRDSGAELGPSSQLGKQIQRRVPLHSHARLESLYSTWVLFWSQSNWTGRDGKSLQVGRPKPNQKLITSGASQKDVPTEDSDSASIKSSSSHGRVPHFLHRFFVGCFYQPLDSIEEYYGEKVAFYFAWLQHCSFHLLYLSLAGLIVFICQLASGNWDHPLRPWFSILVMIWSFVVMVTWRRRSNQLAYQWGTLDYQEEEVARPAFKGTEYRICPVTNTYIPYYPPWKRWLMMCISIPLTVGFTIVTLLGILILYGNRDVILANYFTSTGDNRAFQPRFSAQAIGKTAPILSVELNQAHLHDPNFWLIVIGFPSLLGLILPLLNFLLRRVSLWLNEIENHRTEAEYRTHFIIKVFAFRFVCYFAALYYYSFIGVGSDDPQATEHGILRVASTLFTYLTIAHWWNIFLQVFFPLLLYRWRVYRERLRLRNELRSLEMMELELSPSNEQEMTADERLELKKQLLNKRLLLEHAQVNIWEEMMLPEHDSFTEYLFAVTQFAYVTCFSVVLPITPLIVLINHLLNMRLDAFKICRGRRRPLSQKTGGIGVWSHVLHIVTVIAILTNCSLMALTSSQFSWLADQIGKLGVFALAIGWEHLMLLVKYIMQLTVSTMPAGVQNDMRRKKYDQERKRYMTLRAKKERRSGSVGTAGDKAPVSQNDSDDKGGEAVKIGASFKTSPCPPILEDRESSAESHEDSHSSAKNQAEPNSAKPVEKKDRALEEKTPSGRSIVNVRATKCHSPLQQEERVGLYRKDAGQNLQRSYESVHSTSKPLDPYSSYTTAYEENSHPNFDEAIRKLPPVPRSSSKRSPLQFRDSSLDEDSSPKYMPYSDVKRSYGVPSPLSRQAYSSRRDVGIGHSRLHEEEEVISPSSSLSTIPRLPTPRNLDLDGEDYYDDDETLHTVEDGFATPAAGYYPNATAPPLLSPANDRGYSAKTTRSSKSSYFDALNDADDDDDDHSGPKAKWGVHHILHYSKSERSMSLSERKKSR